MKLIAIHEINATLLLKTGLHIYSGNTEMQIGGVDHTVIRNPITKEPYIPGSSLKGKIRTLLEWLSGKVKSEPLNLKSIHEVDDSIVCNILRLFGFAGHAEHNQELAKQLKTSRLIFWDCNLTQDWKALHQDDQFIPTEVKAENTINRITATANHPRQIERVPAGATFDFKLILREFEDDNAELLPLVLKGLRLLELDSLGGSGSRGYGKVEFQQLTVNGKPTNLNEIDPFK